MTLKRDLPDSYVRCGGDNFRPVPVFTLHAIDADGQNIRPISAFETFEYTPSLTADGRILYCRWDYIDRFNGHYCASPWPLSEDLYLVSWATRPLPPHRRCTDEHNPVNAQGIYLLDRHGNLELLHRDRELSSMTPLPIRKRPRPARQPRRADQSAPPTGSFLLLDIYEGLSGIERGTVRRLRIVGVPPKVQPHMRQALPLASRRAPSKLSPPPQGSWPLRFDRLVQEVLDRHCVSCHKTEAEAAELDLSAGKAYTALLQYADGDLSDGVFERDYSEVGNSPSLHSKLLRYVRQDPLHRQLQLTHEDWLRIYTWMDTYGHVQGSFSQQQEEELIALRDRYRWLFTSDTRLDDYPE